MTQSAPRRPPCRAWRCARSPPTAAAGTAPARDGGSACRRCRSRGGRRAGIPRPTARRRRRRRSTRAPARPTRGSRHRVVPRDGALDDGLAVAGDVDVPAEARQVAWLARRGETLHVASLRIDAPQRPVPEIADPHAIARRRDDTRVRRHGVRRAHLVRGGVDPDDGSAGRNGGRTVVPESRERAPRRPRPRPPATTPISTAARRPEVRPVWTSPSACRTSSTSSPHVGCRSSGSFAIARRARRRPQAGATAAARSPAAAAARGGRRRRRRRSPGERQRPGQRLEEQAAERVDVGAAVDVVADDLLRRDVVDRAHQLAIGRAGVRDALREAEVGQVDVLPPPLLVEQDVRRLHVAVDEPLRVRGVECVRDLRRDGHRPCRRERPLAPQERP